MESESSITDPTGQPSTAHDQSPLGFRWLLTGGFWLWLKPNHFLRRIDTRITSVAVMFCVYLMGITGTADRVDNMILKHYNQGSNEFFIELAQNWLSYWGFILTVGILMAGLIWLFWGWIYILRVRWSGDQAVDPTTARNVYSIVNLVANIPYLMVMIVPILFYPNYLTYFHHEELWSSALLLFAIWGHVAHFMAVKGQFNVVTWKAAIWFLIVPIGFMIAAVYLFLMAL